MMRWGVLLGLVLSWCVVSLSEAQTPSCRKWVSNAANSGADIPVSTVAVIVVHPNTSSCGVSITNTSVSQAIRCRSFADGLPTATLGTRIGAGGTLGLGLAAQDGVRCIRDTTASGDAAVSVGEERP